MAQRNLKQARLGVPGNEGGAGAGAASATAPGSRIQVPDYETIALTLQGGGALGAYQAGVFQGLHEAGIEPNWLAGISIGALNTAIIAGNPPEKRVERLLQFWETICQPAFGLPLPAFIEHAFFNSSDAVRKAFTATQALGALVEGQRASLCRAFRRPCQRCRDRLRRRAITTRRR